MLPWHEEIWSRLTANLERLPHALLLVGPGGGGKRLFAEALARRVLCEGDAVAGEACGKCSSCLWLAAGNHPDFRLLAPDSEAREADGEAEGPPDSPLGGKPKRASHQILIDQVRELSEFMSIGTHRRGMRVVLVDPAEAMNTHTANALLKLLEEPRPSTLFLMIASAPRRLLPTIRSRCQVIALGKPDPVLAGDWLRSRSGIENAETLLAFAGGMPLAAAELAAAGASAIRREFVAAVSAIDRADPLQIAATWEGWLARKGEGGFVLRLATLVAWMQKWVFDLALCKLAGRVAFYPDAKAELQRLAQRSSLADILACYRDLGVRWRTAEHPLNARLFLEDMVMRCADAVSGGVTN